MKKKSSMPTANIAINKSRLKIYNKQNDIPVYYLQKGQEFQIELFNPTRDVILCKIHLNNKSISQGGLILNPGQRVFLDRYIDIAKKFLFDTYQVSNSEEVKEAIQDNGDFKVQFYREKIRDNFLKLNQPEILRPFPVNPVRTPWDVNNQPIWIGGPQNDVYGPNDFTTTCLYSSNMENTNLMNIVSNNVDNSVTLDMLETSINSNKSRRKKSKKKSIETGRVEQGSISNQQLISVEKEFSMYAFHTIEYKLLPLSQKVNTVSDFKKRYCSNCGMKQKQSHNFCPSCGKKV